MTLEDSAKIGDVCRLVNGRAFKPSDWTSEGVPIVRIQNLNDATKPFNLYSGEVKEKFLIDDGDVLLSWSGTPGTSFGCFVWSRGKAILNQHIFKVLVDETRVSKDYFVYAVNSKLEEMIALAHGGVGLRHITKGKLEGIRIPVPSTRRQHEIVERVRACLERTEEIASLRTESARVANALLASSLAATFDRLVDHVKWSPIDEVLVESRYGTSRKCNADAAATPVLRIPNVARGSVNFDDLKYCALDDKELARLSLEQGDLLVVRTNGSPDLVGRCAVFSGNSRPTAFASYLIRLRLNAEVADPRFVAFYLSSTHGRDAIAKIRRTSAGQYNVNSENLRGIEVPLPPLCEQLAVSERLAEQKRLADEIAHVQAIRSNDAGVLRAAVLRRIFGDEVQPSS